MGKFGEQLLGAVSGGLTGGLASGISGSVGGLLGNIGYGRRVKKQLNAQKQLNEQAASLNYEYGEKAAENAYRRQMEMYERSYNDQSYSAMRKQMEDAGLSVGLMYGGNGSGGAGGATTGAPQGATGGAIAGEAPRATEREALALQRTQLGLGLQKLKSEVAINEASVEKIQADAELARSEAGKTAEEKITTMQMREWQVEGAKQLGKQSWISNIRNEYEDSQKMSDPEDMTYYNEKFGEYKIIREATSTQGRIADVLKTIGEANNNEAQASAATALSRLNNAKADGYWKELQIELIKGNALAAMAAAQKLQAETGKLDFEHKYGIKMTAYQWAMLGKDAAQMILGAVGTFKGSKTLNTVTKEIWDKHGEFQGGTTTTTSTTKK